MTAPAASGTVPRYGGNSVLRAVGYMCLSAIFFPVLNASVKYLGARYPITEVFFARYLGHCVICLAIFLPRHGWRLFATSRPGVHALRACLQTIDLTTAAAVSFAGPIVVTALSGPLLRERVGPRAGPPSWWASPAPS